MSPSTPIEAFYYFAYGSNMLTRRLAAAGRAPSARPVTAGSVAGRRLTFDKVGQDGSGKCDAERSPEDGDRVFGVVFQVELRDQPRLDRIEGVSTGYARETVDVLTRNGSLVAQTYIATKKASAVRPFCWYRDLVLAGALEHGLPLAHVEMIRAVEALTDPDTVRSAANRLLLSAS
jgi:cation transport regulator ChaC